LPVDISNFFVLIYSCKLSTSFNFFVEILFIFISSFSDFWFDDVLSMFTMNMLVWFWRSDFLFFLSVVRFSVKSTLFPICCSFCRRDFFGDFLLIRACSNWSSNAFRLQSGSVLCLKSSWPFSMTSTDSCFIFFTFALFYWMLNSLFYLSSIKAGFNF